MIPSDAFFSGNSYAIFGARAKGRAHGPVLIAALRHAGKRAVAIEPDAALVKGADTATSLSVAGQVDGVVLLPPAPWGPESAEFTTEAVHQCKTLGISQMWIYTAGSPDEAVKIAVAEGIDPVAGRCPCLHVVGGGFPHGFHRAILKFAKQL